MVKSLCLIVTVMAVYELTSYNWLYFYGVIHSIKAGFLVLITGKRAITVNHGKALISDGLIVACPARSHLQQLWRNQLDVF